MCDLHEKQEKEVKVSKQIIKENRGATFIGAVGNNQSEGMMIANIIEMSNRFQDTSAVFTTFLFIITLSIYFNMHNNSKSHRFSLFLFCCCKKVSSAQEINKQTKKKMAGIK